MEFVSLWKCKNHRSSIQVINQILELVIYVKGEENRVAHRLAKIASPSSPDCAWNNQVPESILACIEHDVMLV